LEWLQQQDNVAWINHPDLPDNPTHTIAQRLFPQGAGSVLCFGVDGGLQAGVAFINALQLSSNLANVGDCRTLVLHPASTTHSRLDDVSMVAAGLKPDLLRVSVGIEAVGDIQADFIRGLKAARKIAEQSQ